MEGTSSRLNVQRRRFNESSSEEEEDEDDVRTKSTRSNAKSPPILVPPLRRPEHLWSSSVVGVDPCVLPQDEDRQFAEIMFLIKTSSFLPDQSSRDVARDAFHRESLRLDIKVSTDSRQAVFNLRLFIEEVLLAKGKGPSPAEAEDEAFRDLVERIVTSDFLRVDGKSTDSKRKLKLFETEEEVKEFGCTAFRYDLLCRERSPKEIQWPMCTECGHKGHNKFFCLEFKRKEEERPQKTVKTRDIAKVTRDVAEGNMILNDSDLRSKEGQALTLSTEDFIKNIDNLLQSHNSTKTHLISCKDVESKKLPQPYLVTKFNECLPESQVEGDGKRHTSLLLASEKTSIIKKNNEKTELNCEIKDRLGSKRPANADRRRSRSPSVISISSSDSEASPRKKKSSSEIRKGEETLNNVKNLDGFAQQIVEPKSLLSKQPRNNIGIPNLQSPLLPTSNTIRPVAESFQNSMQHLSFMAQNHGLNSLPVPPDNNREIHMQTQMRMTNYFPRQLQKPPKSVYNHLGLPNNPLGFQNQSSVSLPLDGHPHNPRSISLQNSVDLPNHTFDSVPNRPILNLQNHPNHSSELQNCVPNLEQIQQVDILQNQPPSIGQIPHPEIFPNQKQSFFPNQLQSIVQNQQPRLVHNQPRIVQNQPPRLVLNRPLQNQRPNILQNQSPGMRQNQPTSGVQNQPPFVQNPTLNAVQNLPASIEKNKSLIIPPKQPSIFQNRPPYNVPKLTNVTQTQPPNVQNHPPGVVSNQPPSFFRNIPPNFVQNRPPSIPYNRVPSNLQIRPQSFAQKCPVINTPNRPLTSSSVTETKASLQENNCSKNVVPLMKLRPSPQYLKSNQNSSNINEPSQSSTFPINEDYEKESGYVTLSISRLNANSLTKQKVTEIVDAIISDWRPCQTVDHFLPVLRRLSSKPRQWSVARAVRQHLDNDQTELRRFVMTLSHEQILDDHYLVTLHGLEFSYDFLIILDDLRHEDTNRSRNSPISLRTDFLVTQVNDNIVQQTVDKIMSFTNWKSKNVIKYLRSVKEFPTDYMKGRDPEVFSRERLLLLVNRLCFLKGLQEPKSVRKCFASKVLEDFVIRFKDRMVERADFFNLVDIFVSCEAITAQEVVDQLTPKIFPAALNLAQIHRLPSLPGRSNSEQIPFVDTQCNNNNHLHSLVLKVEFIVISNTTDFERRFSRSLRETNCLSMLHRQAGHWWRTRPGAVIVRTDDLAFILVYDHVGVEEFTKFFRLLAANTRGKKILSWSAKDVKKILKEADIRLNNLVSMEDISVEDDSRQDTAWTWDILSRKLTGGPHCDRARHYELAAPPSNQALRHEAIRASLLHFFAFRHSGRVERAFSGKIKSGFSADEAHDEFEEMTLVIE